MTMLERQDSTAQDHGIESASARPNLEEGYGLQSVES